MDKMIELPVDSTAAPHASNRDRILVQVCYATSVRQVLRNVEVPSGTTLHQAIAHSAILVDVPEIDLSCCKVGIYGKVKALDTVLRMQDRIEIYRPLIADPMASRRRRAEKKGLQS
jgi:putative ubiquitin-RnfH superfamily antitoxin RatB of RatAB toxin-antitoxin module